MTSALIVNLASMLLMSAFAWFWYRRGKAAGWQQGIEAYKKSYLFRCELEDAVRKARSASARQAAQTKRQRLANPSAGADDEARP